MMRFRNGFLGLPLLGVLSKGPQRMLGIVPAEESLDVVHALDFMDEGEVAAEGTRSGPPWPR